MEKLFYLDGVDGELTVYENKIVISRSGLLARTIGNKSIPIDSVRYVTLREWTIWKRGEIGFGLDAAPTNVNPFETNKNRENCILFTKAYNEIAKSIAKYIEHRISEIKKTVSLEQEQDKDAADEILKYKNLLDMGAITQSEFESKKKQLLGLDS